MLRIVSRGAASRGKGLHDSRLVHRGSRVVWPQPRAQSEHSEEHAGDHTPDGGATCDPHAPVAAGLVGCVNVVTGERLVLTARGLRGKQTHARRRIWRFFEARQGHRDA